MSRQRCGSFENEKARTVLIYTSIKYCTYRKQFFVITFCGCSKVCLSIAIMDNYLLQIVSFYVFYILCGIILRWCRIARKRKLFSG